MYSKILVTLEHGSADEALLPHVKRLAVLMQSELLLVHVADGWVARNYTHLNLADSEEMRDDQRYLEEVAERLRAETGLRVSVQLALGTPSDKILEVAASERCDCIAMASHGHRLVGDILHGSTIEAVRHRARVAMVVVPPKHAAPVGAPPA